MWIGPGRDGISAFIILKDGERIPEKYNDVKILVMRRGESTNRELVVVKELGKLADPSLLRVSEPLVCNYNRTDGNPLHQHMDGTWWFYEETWALELGPFDTIEASQQALTDYCAAVLKAREESQQ